MDSEGRTSEYRENTAEWVLQIGELDYFYSTQRDSSVHLLTI